MAVMVAGADGVRVEPIIDITKLGLAFVTAMGFMAAAWLRFVSPRRALREMRGS